MRICITVMNVFIIYSIEDINLYRKIYFLIGAKTLANKL